MESLEKCSGNSVAVDIHTQDPGVKNPGGQMSISPPSKVNDEDIKCLSSNIDSLVLSLYVDWKDYEFTEYLCDMKDKAISQEKEIPVFLSNDPTYKFGKYFNILNYGLRGFYLLLQNRDYFIKIGDYDSESSRPNVVIEIRSETLWRLGAENAVNDILEFLTTAGAKIKKALASRVDICVDMLIPESIWTTKMIKNRVTRANHLKEYFFNDKLTGVMIGSGAISARLYDKALEIHQQSKKYWMHDIWRLKKVPSGKKVIRIEFQLRREVIKELGISTIEDVLKHRENLWLYCTKKWLKFQSKPGMHHTQRKTLKWWKAVQLAKMQNTAAYPLIRNKAVTRD